MSTAILESLVTLRPNDETEVRLVLETPDDAPGFLKCSAFSETPGQLDGGLFQASATDNGGLSIRLVLLPGTKILVLDSTASTILYDSEA